MTSLPTLSTIYPPYAEAVVPRKHRYPKTRKLWAAEKEPPPDAWIAIATEEATRAGCRPYKVLGGVRERIGKRGALHMDSCVVARWRAWRRIKAEYPEASIAGIGRVSGFDHTAILRAMKRLAEVEANTSNQPRRSA